MRIIPVFVIVSCFFSLGHWSYAQQSQPSNTPNSKSVIVGALLVDPAFRTMPLVALLEAQLAQKTDLQLVERQEIEKVLSEQKLQLLFGAESAEERIRVGQLIRADVLILLRQRQGNESKSLDVVICESHSGLRLFSASFSGTDEPSVLSPQILGRVDQAIINYRSSVRQIIAVPPFAGSDFLHRYDYLQRLYAHILQEQLASEPGLIVVELEEARAIAAELDVSTGGQNVQRSLPLYLLGEYQIAKVEKPTVSLKLTLRRGEQNITEKNSSNLALDEAIGYLKQTTRELLGQLQQAGNAGFDPKIEVEGVLRRSHVYKTTHDYQLALELIESALLLAPQRVELYAEAIELSTIMMKNLSRGSWVRGELMPDDPIDEYASRAALAMNYYKLDIEYTERWLRLQDLRKVKNLETLQKTQSALHSWKKEDTAVDVEQQFQEQLESLYEQWREMIYRVVRDKVQVGEFNHQINLAMTSALHISSGWKADISAQRRYIELIADLPGIENDVLAVILSGLWYPTTPIPEPIPMNDRLVKELIDPANFRWIAELRSIPGRSTQAAAEKLVTLIQDAGVYLHKKESESIRRQIQERQEQKQYTYVKYKENDEIIGEMRLEKQKLSQKHPSFQPPKPTPPPDEVSLELLQLTILRNGRAEKFEWGNWPVGWFVCDDGIEVAWTSDEVLVMEKPGQFKSLYRANEMAFRSTGDGTDFNEVVYDGRYLWAPAVYAKEPYLVAIDPRAEKVFVLAAQQGLPPMTIGPRIAPVSPGCVCVAGAFGKPGTGRNEIDRTWCGLITLSETGELKVNLILEASGVKPDQPSSKKTFFPGRMISLHPPSRPKDQLIFLQPTGSKSWIQINPSDPSAEDHFGPSRDFTPEGSFKLNGSFYFADRSNSRASLTRIDCHDLEGTEIPDIWPQDNLARVRALQTDGRMILALRASQWLLGPCCDQQLTLLRGELPRESYLWNPNPRICYSKFYGFILLAGSMRSESPNVFQIKIDPARMQQLADAPKQQTANPGLLADEPLLGGIDTTPQAEQDIDSPQEPDWFFRSAATALVVMLFLFGWLRFRQRGAAS